MIIISQKTLINIKMIDHLPTLKTTLKFHNIRRCTCLPNFLKAEQIEPFRKGRFIDPPTARKSRIQEAWS
jgi:hypothetical protein